MENGDLNRILYVEDDADIRSVATFALETLGGFTVAGYESGVMAIAHAASFRPQLLLLDVMMPGMDGPTTLTGLRDDPGLRDVPVVFMTAKVQPQEVTRYLAMGALDVIAKPFDPMALSTLVREIWDRRPR
jgi:two-component system, OmpR family, response regulator